MECKDNPRHGNSELRLLELIDTLWNVKKYDEFVRAEQARRINRYTMECKGHMAAGLAICNQN